MRTDPTALLPLFAGVELSRRDGLLAPPTIYWQNLPVLVTPYYAQLTDAGMSGGSSKSIQDQPLFVSYGPAVAALTAILGQPILHATGSPAYPLYVDTAGGFATAIQPDTPVSYGYVGIGNGTSAGSGSVRITIGGVTQARVDWTANGAPRTLAIYNGVGDALASGSYSQPLEQTVPINWSYSKATGLLDIGMGFGSSAVRATVPVSTPGGQSVRCYLFDEYARVESLTVVGAAS